MLEIFEYNIGLDLEETEDDGECKRTVWYREVFIYLFW
jgi:hypothetical protein